MKTSYEILSIQVDKLYNDNVNLSEENDINDFLNYIETFIVACGWTVDDFIARMVSEVYIPCTHNLN